MILFDFPLNSTEYLHRVGAYARRSSRGPGPLVTIWLRCFLLCMLRCCLFCLFCVPLLVLLDRANCEGRQAGCGHQSCCQARPSSCPCNGGELVPASLPHVISSALVCLTLFTRPQDAALRGSGFEALSSDKRAYVPGAQKGRHGGSSKKPARVFREERGPRRKGKSGGAGARAGGGGGKSTAPPVQFEWSNSRAPSSSPATSATRRRSDRQRAGQSGREHTGSATPAGAGAANSRTVKRRGDSMVVNRVKRK